MSKSNLLDLLRAKSDGNEMLLKDHIKSVIERVIHLRRVLGDYVFNNEFWRYLVLASFFHDLGKITYSFQQRVNNGALDEELNTFLKNTRDISIRHEILSALWASLFLNKNYKGTKFVRSAVLLHHYNSFYNNNEIDLGEIITSFQIEIEKYLDFLIYNWDKVEKMLKELKNYIVDDTKDDFVRNVLNDIVLSKDRVVEFKNIINEKEDPLEFAEFYEFNSEHDIEFFLFLGMLRRADYSASGNVEIELMNKDLHDTVKNRIYNKFGKNIWQEQLLDSKNGKDMVLIAPTGSGKTEFSLLWNTRLKRKLVYTLPLRVALNDLYGRFRNYAQDEKYVGLLHSTAFLEFLKESDLTIDEKLTSSKILAEPLILSTPDQVFLISLKYYGFDKVLSVAPYSSFVIDEIQAYSPEMAAVAIKSLEMLKDAGANLLIMTATLPPYFRDFLKKKIKLEENEIIDISEESIDNVKNLNVKRHRIALEPIDVSDSTDKNEEYKRNLMKNLAEKVKDLMNDGKRILIILNNVKKAINIYEELKKIYSDNIYLLHSRLIEKQKENVIKEVKKKLKNRKPVILISTQVVEASVDFDFDVLLTELSPIDSQIQRWGRVWRNRINKETGESEDYTESDPNIYVFYGRENNDVYVDKGTNAIYSPKEYLIKTFDILNSQVKENKILNYEDEKKLIDEVFDDDLKKIFSDQIKDIYKFLDYWNASKKSEAQRVFRKLAGVQVVFPEILTKVDELIEFNREQGNDDKDTKGILEKEDIEKIKNLGKIIKEFLRDERKEPTYDELIDLLNLENNEVSRYKIRSYLTLFSLNIPVYYFSTKDGWDNFPFKKQFKGFYVAALKQDVDVNILIECGLDAVIKGDIDTIIEDNLNKTIPPSNIF